MKTETNNIAYFDRTDEVVDFDNMSESDESVGLKHAHDIGTLKENRVNIDDILQSTLTRPKVIDDHGVAINDIDLSIDQIE